MKISALQGFAQTANSGSLSTAAALLNISEPALSRQISNLEDELGLTLFARDKRRLQITEEGEAFLTEIQSILEAVSQIPTVVQDIKAKKRRRVRLVSMPRLSAAIAAPAVARFTQDNPDILVSADVQQRLFLERWIATRNFDVGLATLPTHHESIVSEPLITLGAVAVLHPGHPLAGADRLNIRDLAHDPFIGVKPGTLNRQMVERIFDKARLSPTPVVEVSLSHLACNMVAEGAGYTISDPLAVHAFRDRIRTVPLYPKQTTEFGLLWPRGQDISDATTQLVDTIRDVAARFAD